MIEQVLAY